MRAYMLALALPLAVLTACSTSPLTSTEECPSEPPSLLGRNCVPDSKDREALPNTAARYGTRSMEEYAARRVSTSYGRGVHSPLCCLFAMQRRQGLRRDRRVAVGMGRIDEER